MFSLQQLDVELRLGGVGFFTVTEAGPFPVSEHHSALVLCRSRSLSPKVTCRPETLCVFLSLITTVSYPSTRISTDCTIRAGPIFYRQPTDGPTVMSLTVWWGWQGLQSISRL